MKNNLILSAALVAALAVNASAQSNIQGTTSTDNTFFSGAPYINGTQSNVTTTSILTTGDSIGGYTMVGVPDGLGAYDNGNGTFTVLMNHEFSTFADGTPWGTTRAHGGAGSFVSKWVIDKTTLQVQSGSDLIQSVIGWDKANQTFNSTPNTAVNRGLSFNRFCSADLAPTSGLIYTNSAGTFGTTERLFLNGEEGLPSGTTAASVNVGRSFASVVTGTNAGTAYELGKFSIKTASTTGGNFVPAMENLLVNPTSQLKTIVGANSDGGNGLHANAVGFYVGTKQQTGNEVEKAGLANGTFYFVNVTGNAAEINNTTSRTTGITNGTAFTLSTTASTTFSRPEDGAWDTYHPNTYYFVTTDQLDKASDGLGAQIGSTRLWKLTFTDISQPELGGTINLVIDGNTAQTQFGLSNKPNMFDNISFNADGTIVICEDTGNSPSHASRVWQYDTASGTLKVIDQFTSQFNGTSFTNGYSTDKETSGVLDITSVLGRGDGQSYYLIDVQNHATVGLNGADVLGTSGSPGTLAEGGQLLVIAVPEPSTYALLVCGLVVVVVAVRRRQVNA